MTTVNLSVSVRDCLAISSTSAGLVVPLAPEVFLGRKLPLRVSHYLKGKSPRPVLEACSNSGLLLCSGSF